MIPRHLRVISRITAFIKPSAAEVEFFRSIPFEDSVAAAGETILEDRHTSGLALLVKGWAANAVVSPDGSTRVHAIHLPGDIAGMASSILAEPIDYTFAITDTVFTVMSKNFLSRTFEEQPRLAATILLIAQEERAMRMEWGALAQSTGAARRLAAFLFRLGERVRRLLEDHPETLELPLTQKLIGEAIGVTPVYMNRLVKEFRARGLVDVRQSYFAITDMEGLKELAQIGQWKVRTPAWLPESR